jgi:uncharacterized membrane protein YccF (DUF307 family)
MSTDDRLSSLMHDPLLRMVLNLLWVVFGGWLIFLEYLLGGAILCITIIGIPFGIQCFKIAYLGLLPFGKRVVYHEQATGCLSLAMNIIWVLVAGVWIALTHLGLALGWAITIIGIPFAVQHLKLAALCFAPFGMEIVPIEESPPFPPPIPGTGPTR